MILTNLILHVAEMSRIKCNLKPTYGFGGVVENVKSLQQCDECYVRFGSLRPINNLSVI